jgi:hypothetical protein
MRIRLKFYPIKLVHEKISSNEINICFFIERRNTVLSIFKPTILLYMYMHISYHNLMNLCVYVSKI